jgi:hypothetical protein
MKFNKIIPILCIYILLSACSSGGGNGAARPNEVNVIVPPNRDIVVPPNSTVIVPPNSRVVSP